MLPIQRKISAYNHFNSNNVRYIVIHDVGTKSTAKNNVDYFSGGDRGASAHYFVDDGSIWQSVEDHHGAWHVGDGGNKYGINNQNTIGIEMCLPGGTVTAKTEQNTIELTKYLMAKYGVPIDRVVRHYDASRKNCPAQFNLDGKWTRWTQFKQKLAGQSVTAPTAPTKPTTQNTIKMGEIGMFIYYQPNAKGASDIFGVWGNKRFHLNNMTKVGHFKNMVKDTTGKECKEYKTWARGSEQIKTVESFTDLQKTIL